MKNIHVFCFFCIMAVVFLGGCSSGTKPPEGMPELAQTTLTFTRDGGQPLANATVTLIAQDSANVVWPAGGQTDSQGKLKVKTMSKFDGVVPGQYKIVLSKTEITGLEANAESSDDASVKKQASSAKTYNLIEEKYRSVKSTPLSLEVTASGPNEQTFDAGKSVHEIIVYRAD